ncbi:hypothetical protein ACP70R_032447 [Stipagrostis hirtigluma subsp. patula]
MLLLGNPMVSTPAAVGETRRAQRADGPASVLAVGTANPANCVRQEDYADYYFRVTKSDHLVNLKAKLKRICHKSAITKRYFHHTEQMLDDHPEILDRKLPSLDARMNIAGAAVPELAAAAAAEAIAEWGRPAEEIVGASHRILTHSSTRTKVEETQCKHKNTGNGDSTPTATQRPGFSCL